MYIYGLRMDLHHFQNKRSIYYGLYIFYYIAIQSEETQELCYFGL